MYGRQRIDGGLTLVDHGGEDSPEERRLLGWCQRYFGDAPHDAAPRNVDSVMVIHIRNARLADGCVRLVDFARRLMEIDSTGTIGVCRQEWDVSRVVRRGSAAVIAYVRSGAID